MHSTSNIERMPLLENTSDDRGESSAEASRRRHPISQVPRVESGISATVEGNFHAEATQEGFVASFKRFCIRTLCCGDKLQPEDESAVERVNKPIGKAIDHFTDMGNLIEAIKSFP